MMNEQNAVEFINLLEMHIKKYGELKELEEQKAEDLANNNLSVLDEYVRREEAHLLSIRGLEAAWDKFLNENKIDGKKMTDIIALLPENYLEKGNELFKTLSGILIEVREINNRCSSMAKTKIEIAQKAVSYTKNGKKSDNQKAVNQHIITDKV